MVHPNSAGRDFGCGATYCIFFDNTLCHVATLLKIGLMQIVLAMIEAERVDAHVLRTFLSYTLRMCLV